MYSVGGYFKNADYSGINVQLQKIIDWRTKISYLEVYTYLLAASHMGRCVNCDWTELLLCYLNE